MGIYMVKNMELWYTDHKKPEASDFEWDEEKERTNFLKHGVSFAEAQYAFFDPNCIIAEDKEHSLASEIRFYCFAKVGREVMTVRFTYRNNKIRIIGAGYWRKGRKIYEKATSKKD